MRGTYLFVVVVVVIVVVVFRSMALLSSLLTLVFASVAAASNDDLFRCIREYHKMVIILCVMELWRERALVFVSPERMFVETHSDPNYVCPFVRASVRTSVR